VKKENEQNATNPRDCGIRAEDCALAHLQSQGLTLLTRNYRMPGRRGNEIDLILREKNGTIVFVEVRSKRCATVGGYAAESVTSRKQHKIIRAAQYYLLKWRTLPPCRFDVVSIDNEVIEWIKAAFNAE
jgi:putative endonuclease